MYKLSNEEKENITLSHEGSKTTIVETYNKRMKRDIKNALEWYPDEVTILEENEDGRVKAIVPARMTNRLNFRKPMSEERKKAAAENLRKTRKANK